MPPFLSGTRAANKCNRYNIAYRFGGQLVILRYSAMTTFKIPYQYMQGNGPKSGNNIQENNAQSV